MPSVQQKHHKTYKETEKCDPFKDKNVYQRNLTLNRVYGRRGARWHRRGREITLFIETPKSQITVEKPLTKNAGMYQKDTSYPKAKKKPQRDDKRDTIMIKSNLKHTG